MTDCNPPLRLADESSFRRVREFLELCGYTEEAAAERIGFPRLDQLSQYALCDQAKRDRNLRIRDSLNVVVQLFLCGRAMEAEELRQIPTDVSAALESLALIERDGSKVFSPVLLYPAHGLYLASDRYMNPDGSSVSTGSDFVYLVLQRNTTDFMASLPGPRGSFLDLGSGCGVAGLWAAKNGADHVWCTDINSRATHLAEFNRRLNGIGNVTVMQGNLYEPVRHLRFDHIACHPPYAISMRPGYVYADGGEDGEALLRRVVECAPAQLKPGGLFTSFQVASDREGELLEQRVRGWLGAENTGFDVATVVDDLVAPMSYVMEEISAGQSTSKDLVRWRELFARYRIETMVYGAVYIRRHSRSDMIPFTTRRMRSSETSRGALESMFKWEAAAAQPDRDGLLLEVRPKPSLHAELIVRHKSRDGSLQPMDYTFRTQVPFDTTLSCRAWMAYLFSKCDGQRTGAELFAEVADRLPAGLDQKHFLNALSALISGGFLEIGGFTLPAAE